MNNLNIDNLKVNKLDYLGFISIGYLLLNNEKYEISSPTLWLNNLGWNLVYILVGLFSLKFIVMILGDDNNIYITRGKQLFTLLSGGLSFTFSYVMLKLINMEINYNDSIRLKWNTYIKRKWDSHELLDYLKEKVNQLYSTNPLLNDQYNISMKNIKVDSNDLNKLVANNSTMESLNKSLDDLINQKTELLKAQLERELNDSSSLIRSLVDGICGMPTHYYWIGGLLATGLAGASWYFLKDQFILRGIIHLKNALIHTNTAVNQTNTKYNLLSVKINEVIARTNGNSTAIISSLSRLDQLEGHQGISQAIMKDLPVDQLKDPIIKDFLIKLLTDENLFILLELCELLLGMDALCFERLETLLGAGDNRTQGAIESTGRRIIRRGNFASFDN